MPDLFDILSGIEQNKFRYLERIIRSGKFRGGLLFLPSEKHEDNERSYQAGIHRLNIQPVIELNYRWAYPDRLQQEEEGNKKGYSEIPAGHRF